MTFPGCRLVVPDELREIVDGIGYTRDHAVLEQIGAMIPASRLALFDQLVRRGATQIIVNPVPTAEDRERGSRA